VRLILRKMRLEKSFKLKLPPSLARRPRWKRRRGCAVCFRQGCVVRLAQVVAYSIRFGVIANSRIPPNSAAEMLANDSGAAEEKIAPFGKQAITAHIIR